MLAVLGRTGGLTDPCPGAEDVQPVLVIPVYLPCLNRGHRDKKVEENMHMNSIIKIPFEIHGKQKASAKSGAASGSTIGQSRSGAARMVR